MLGTKRYVVRPWDIGNGTMYCVWDTVTDQRHLSPVWLTKRFAQEDADKLNETVVEVNA